MSDAFSRTCDTCSDEFDETIVYDGRCLFCWRDTVAIRDVELAAAREENARLWIAVEDVLENNLPKSWHPETGRIVDTIWDKWAKQDIISESGIKEKE